MAARLSKEDFDTVISGQDVPVLVDFYSDSCIPCKQLSPILGDIEEEYEDRIKVYKVNVNFDQEIAARFQVMSAPTLILFQKGEPADKKPGLQKKADLKAWIDSYLA
ncbi:MAG: thioredoxin [Suilimivivens sp.]